MDPQSFHLGCLHISGFWISPLDSLPAPGRKRNRGVACEVWVASPEDSVAPFCSCYWPDPSLRSPHNCRGSWKVWPSCALEEMEAEFDIHILLATYCLSDSSWY